MVSIRSIGTALPQYHYLLTDIQQIAARWLQGDTTKTALFNRFVQSSDTKSRYFAIPADEILELKGLAERTRLFETLAPALGVTAVKDALYRARVSPSQIHTQVFTSCSCPIIPSVDALIIQQSGLAETIRRVPIYQYGCAGGVAGLGLAAALQQTTSIEDKDSYTLLTATELCSLVFHPTDHRASLLVGAALFGDGAASVVLGSESDGLVIIDHRSNLLPNSRHLMGYDTYDDGYHLRLDKELPSVLATQVTPLVDSFLNTHNLDRDGVKHWLFHPGGMRVLETLEQVLGISSNRARWSREVLTSVGNLSSASVLFVLDYFLKSKEYADGDHVVLVGIGPGLTLELVLFEWRGER